MTCTCSQDEAETCAEMDDEELLCAAASSRYSTAFVVGTTQGLRLWCSKGSFRDTANLKP